MLDVKKPDSVEDRCPVCRRESGGILTPLALPFTLRSHKLGRVDGEDKRRTAMYYSAVADENELCVDCSDLLNDG